MAKTKSAARRIKKPNSVALPQAAKGEIYKGCFPDGGKLRHVFERTLPAQSATYDKGMEIAKQRDYQLPDRREGALLRASDPRGQTGWFWLREQYEAYSDYAYAQYFGNGTQYNYHKDHEFRVRLVRSVIS